MKERDKRDERGERGERGEAIARFYKALALSRTTRVITMNTYEEKPTWSLKAFLKKALKGERQGHKEKKKWKNVKKEWKEEEKKFKEEQKKKEKEWEKAEKKLKKAEKKLKKAKKHAELHLERIPPEREEKEGVQMQHCEEILERRNLPREEKKESRFRRFLKLFRCSKTSKSSETTTLKIVDTKKSQEMPREEPTYTEHQQDVATRRTELMEMFFKSNDPAERRVIKNKVVAHTIINKIPSTRPEEMRKMEISETRNKVVFPTIFKFPSTHPKKMCKKIPARASELEEEDIHYCKKLEMEEEKKVEKVTTNTFTEEEKRKVEDKVEEKKLEMEEKKVEKETTNTFTEEEKRKLEEEVKEKKKNKRKVKAMRDRRQRVKLYTTMTDTEDPEEKRKLTQQVIAHRIINKIGVPCDGQRRNSILCRDMPREEKEKHQKAATLRTELIRMSFDKDPAEARDLMHKVIAQKIIKKVPSTCPKEMRYRIPARASELEEEDTHYVKNIFDRSNSFTEEEKGRVEEKKVEKEKTKTFTEEEKKKVERKKKNERKVKAMRHSIQRMKLYTTMTDTEDPEEKRKLMQQVIAQRMIDKIGVPCAGQRRNSDMLREEEQKKVQKERRSCSWCEKAGNKAPRKLAIDTYPVSPEEIPPEEYTNPKEAPARRTELMRIYFDTKDPAERRDTMHKVVAHTIINKVPSTCSEEMRFRIPARASELGVEDFQELENRFDISNYFGEEDKEIQKESDKRKLEEEVERKKKNERKVKAMRDRIQRMKLYTTMTDTEDPEEKRKLMQQVIAHRIINKIGVPCSERRRNSIPRRSMLREGEAEELIKTRRDIRYRDYLERIWTIHPTTITPEPKEVAQQKKIEEKEMEMKMEKETTNTFTEEEKRKVEEMKIPRRSMVREEEEEEQTVIRKDVRMWNYSEKAWNIQTTTIALEPEQIAQRKKAREEEKWKEKMEKEKFNSLTEEEKRKVEAKKIHEQKAEALWDRMQKMTLRTNTKSTEDTEEKRKQWREMVAKRTVKQICISFAGGKISLIVVREEKKKEPEEQKEEKPEMEVKVKKQTEAVKKINTFTEEYMTPNKELKERRKMERKIAMMSNERQRMQMIRTMAGVEDPEERRKLMQQVIAHRIINKIGVPCAGRRRNSILCRDMPREEKEEEQM